MPLAYGLNSSPPARPSSLLLASNPPTVIQSCPCSLGRPTLAEGLGPHRPPLPQDLGPEAPAGKLGESGPPVLTWPHPPSNSSSAAGLAPPLAHLYFPSSGVCSSVLHPCPSSNAPLTLSLSLPGVHSPVSLTCPSHLPSSLFPSHFSFSLPALSPTCDPCPATSPALSSSTLNTDSLFPSPLTPTSVPLHLHLFKPL